MSTKLDELKKNVRDEAEKIKADDLTSIEFFFCTEIENIHKHLREMSSTLESLEKYNQTQQLFITSKHYFADVLELTKTLEEISQNHIRKKKFFFFM